MRWFRTLALWLGLTALSVQALAPLCLAGMMAEGGGSEIVLCTAHGFQTVHVDANGKPVPAPASDQNSTCPLCAAVSHATTFTTPAVFVLLAPTAVAESVPPQSSRVALRTAHTLYRGRAPPAELLTVAI